MRKVCEVEYIKHIGLHPARCKKCGAGHAGLAGMKCSRRECGESDASGGAGELEHVCVWKVSVTVDDGTGQAVLQLLGKPAENMLR